MEWEAAPDVKKLMLDIIKSGIFPHINSSDIFALRGAKSTSRAIARIWSFPRPWQISLNIGPKYIIEVIKNRFDKLSLEDKTRVLIHELMHIPKTFSGSLVAHRNRGTHINRRTVEANYQKFLCITKCKQ